MLPFLPFGPQGGGPQVAPDTEEEDDTDSEEDKPLVYVRKKGRRPVPTGTDSEDDSEDDTPLVQRQKPKTPTPPPAPNPTTPATVTPSPVPAFLPPGTVPATPIVPGTTPGAMVYPAIPIPDPTAPVPVPVPVPVPAPTPMSVEVDNAQISFVSRNGTEFENVVYSGILTDGKPDDSNGMLTMELEEYNRLDDRGFHFVYPTMFADEYLDENTDTIKMWGRFEDGVFMDGTVVFRRKIYLFSGLGRHATKLLQLDVTDGQTISILEWTYDWGVTPPRMLRVRMDNDSFLIDKDGGLTTTGKVRVQVESPGAPILAEGELAYAKNVPFGPTSFKIYGVAFKKMVAIFSTVGTIATAHHVIAVPFGIRATSDGEETMMSPAELERNGVDAEFEGSFGDDGKLSGPAKRTLSKRGEYVRYEGLYNNGQAEDPNGVLTYSNGWKYRGGVKNDRQDGDGVLVSPSRDRWQGRWSDGRRTSDLGQFIGADGRIVRGWWEYDQSFVDTTSYARRDSAARQGLKTNPKLRFTAPYDKISSIVVQKPQYDVIMAAQGEIVLRRASSLTTTTIQKLFESTNPAKLGVGRDSGNYMGHSNLKRYHQLKPIRVFDVDYTKNRLQREWERSQSKHFDRMAYCITGNNPNPNRRSDVGKGQVQPAPDSSLPANEDDPLYVRTRIDRLPGLSSEGSPLEGDINEKFLVHGTTAANVLPMLLQGPTNQFSSGGAFGKAVYFAEDVGKSDQYCKTEHGTYDIDYGPNGIIKKMLGIKPEDYDDAVVSANGKKDVFYMFVVRVALGCPALLEASDYRANRAGKPGTEANKQRLMFEPKDMKESAAVSAAIAAGTYGAGVPGMGSAYKLDNQFQSVIIDDWGPHASLNMRYREFMVYSGFVAKITHVVAYKRMAVWPVSIPRTDINGLTWKPHPNNFDLDPALNYTDPLAYKGNDSATGKPNWKVPVVDPVDFDVDDSEDTPASVLYEMNDARANSAYPDLPDAPPAAAAGPSAAAGAGAAAAAAGPTFAPPPGGTFPFYTNDFDTLSNGSVEWKVTKHNGPSLSDREIAYEQILKAGRSFYSTYHSSGSPEQALITKLAEILRSPTSGFKHSETVNILACISMVFKSLSWNWKDGMDGLSTWTGKQPGKVGKTISYADVSIQSVTRVALLVYKVTLSTTDTFDILHACICASLGVATGWQKLVPKFDTVPPRVEKKWKDISSYMYTVFKAFKVRGLALNGSVTAAQINAVNP